MTLVGKKVNRDWVISHAFLSSANFFFFFFFCKIKVFIGHDQSVKQFRPKSRSTFCQA